VKRPLQARRAEGCADLRLDRSRSDVARMSEATSGEKAPAFRVAHAGYESKINADRILFLDDASENFATGFSNRATKTPAGCIGPPRRALIKLASSFLEDSEHDRANEGKCDIRGNNAQPARERSHESHPNFSMVHVVPTNLEASDRFPPEKVSAPVPRVFARTASVVKKS
jgi:hypothetical protein